jgi:hypothetical protein
MLYFNTLPKILTNDNKNNAIVLTNLLARVELVQNLMNNPLLFYNYDIQDGDTPDIIASKYYGDPYRYWLVLFSNQILDPQWEWPISSQQFTLYLNDKYSVAANTNANTVLAYTSSTTYEYRKIITTTDQTTLTTTSKTYVIDEPTYLATIPSTQTITFTNGTTATQTIAIESVSIYDWETEQNEAKRNIKLINAIYAPQFESQFKSLMGT